MNELETRFAYDIKNKSSDIFQTPNIAVDYLLPYIQKNHHVVWESACGNFMIKDYLIEKGYSVYGTDIIDGIDFFKYEPEFSYDVQITNPPYSLKDDWLERSYKLGKPFALLLPVNSLHSVRRCKMFREYGLQLIIPPRRINFITPTGDGTGAWFPVIWFC